MANETLRRNLDAAFDPGPDFPNSLLLSRTMAMLDVGVEIGARGAKRTSYGQRSAVWLRPGMRLTAVLMAVIIAAVATATFLALHKVSTPAPAKTYTNSVARSCSQGGLHMVSRSIGWNGTTRTIDGGVTWSDVSPEWLPVETKGARVTCVLDAEHAWVTEVVGSSDSQTGRLYVFSTHNAGQTWQSSGPFPISGAAPFIHLEFIDYQHGWLQTDGGKYSNQPVTPLVYSTRDGGIHWDQVEPKPDGVWPAGTWLNEYYVCKPNGMMFVSLTRGWLVSDCTPGIFDAGLRVGIVTDDGGQSWLALKLDYSNFPPNALLPKPGATLFWSCGASTPVFSHSVGVLPVSCVSFKGLHGSDGSWSPGIPTGSGWSGVFRTTNSGISWTLAAIPAYVRLSQINFVDADNGFAFVEAGRGNALYRTIDGGRDWVLVKSGLFSGQQITTFQFVDSMTGFAYASGSSSRLWMTTDGGITWSITAS